MFRRGLVAGHPEVQARVAAELESLGLLATPGNPAPRRLEYADLAKLPYMDAVLRESLRLLPVSAAGLQRITPRDQPVTDIGGYAVPANTEVLVRVSAVCVLWDCTHSRFRQMLQGVCAILGFAIARSAACCPMHRCLTMAATPCKRRGGVWHVYALPVPPLGRELSV